MRPRLRSGQVHVWQRQVSQFKPQRIDKTLPVKRLAFLASQELATARDEVCEKSGLTNNSRTFRTAGPYRAEFVRGRT